jgi:serine protease Do
MKASETSATVRNHFLILIPALCICALISKNAQGQVASLSKLENNLIETVEKVTPIVVTIRTTSSKAVNTGAEGGAHLEKNPAGKGKDDGKKSSGSGQGSGIIVSSAGHILTPLFVVKDADVIKVTLNDNRSFRAKPAGSDPYTGLAIIKIDANNLPTAKFGDSDKVRPGQMVLSVGSPYSLPQTASLGIVSAKGRSKTGSGNGGDMIQTDAMIAPGSAGAALTDTQGRLIGIVTSTLSQNGYRTGGFAIPSNTVVPIMKKLIAEGVVRRGLLGVMIKDLDKALAKSFGLKNQEGALAIRVNKGSAADKAGIKEEDIIVAVDGERVASANHLKKLIIAKEPGALVSLTVIRNGKKIVKPVTLGSRIGGKPKAGPSQNSKDKTDILGLETKRTPDDIQKKMGLNKGEGVVVTKVDKDGVATEIGIRVGDVILKVNGEAISGVSSFNKAVEQAKRNKVVRLKVKRGNNVPNIVAAELE